MVLELTSQNFKSEVTDFKGIVLVDFWAEWCGPCKMIGPVIEDVADDFKDKERVKICKLNVDESSEIAQKYGIMSIPALKIFKDGEVVEELVGLQPKEIIEDKINELVVD